MTLYPKQFERSYITALMVYSPPVVRITNWAVELKWHLKKGLLKAETHYCTEVNLHLLYSHSVLHGKLALQAKFQHPRSLHLLHPLHPPYLGGLHSESPLHCHLIQNCRCHNTSVDKSIRNRVSFSSLCSVLGLSCFFADSFSQLLGSFSSSFCSLCFSFFRSLPFSSFKLTPRGTLHLLSPYLLWSFS